MKKPKPPVLNQTFVRLGALARADGLKYDYVEKDLLRDPLGKASWEHGWSAQDIAEAAKRVKKK